jgi:hypothetical protein
MILERREKEKNLRNDAFSVCHAQPKKTKAIVPLPINLFLFFKKYIQ